MKNDACLTWSQFLGAFSSPKHFPGAIHQIQMQIIRLGMGKLPDRIRNRELGGTRARVGYSSTRVRAWARGRPLVCAFGMDDAPSGLC